MKKSFQTGIAALITTLFFSSCHKELVVGNGPVVTEMRTVSNFTGVSFKTTGKVNFKIDSLYKVEVSAQRNILDVLRTTIVNGVLVIDFINNVRVRNHEDITVNVTAPSANYFSISGTGDINAEGELTANSLDLSVSGLGNIVVQKAAVNGKIKTGISGSGNISIATGTAMNEELHISGTGYTDLSNVVAHAAETRTSGSGDIRVNVSDRLELFITGSGSVYYRGQPLIITHISGSGEVRPL